MTIKVLKVSGTSNVNAVAEAIIRNALNDSIVHIDSIGIKAAYTAIKALIHTTDFVVQEGHRINLRPYYVTVNTSENGMQPVTKTAIRWTLIAKKN